MRLSCVRLNKVIMNAIRVHSFGGPEVLKLETNVPVPEVGANQVLVKIFAAGVNPIDTYIRSGIYGAVDFPYIPGKDGAGVVTKLGSNVRNLQVGQRVYGSLYDHSGYSAQYAVADESCVFPLNDKLSFEQGAAVGVPYFTAYRALFQKGKAVPGESILVHGASGAVGIAAVQMARAHGLIVYGTAGTDEGAKIVLESGAQHVFNHRKDGYTKEILDATGNNGVNIILENLANVNLSNDLDLLAQNGRVLVVGNRGTIEINPRAAMKKESSITGVMIAAATKSEHNEMVAAITAGITTGWVNPVIHRVYPLEEIAQAHTDIIESSGAQGNLILKINH